MDKRTWIIFAVAVVAILAGLVMLSRQNKVDVSDVKNSEIRTTPTNDSGIADHVFGNKDSKVVLIEYGDFQCPGCGTFHRNFEPVMDEYKDKIAFVFRNFPITQIHPNARVAAATAEAAGLQGKYWEMWNLIYNKQNDWSSAGIDERDKKFEGYAEELKLDMEKFRTDVASDKVNKKINYDQALGKANGVTGTPTLFLKGDILATDKYKSTDLIRSTLDTALSQAK